MLGDNSEVLSTSFSGSNHCIRVDFENCCRQLAGTSRRSLTVIIAYGILDRPAFLQASKTTAETT